VPRYLSPDWFAAANEAAHDRRLAGGDLVLRQVITGAPDAPGGEVRYQVRIGDGHITLEPDGPSTASTAVDATFTEDYPTAVAMFRGELSPQDALMAGRVSVAGNVAAVVANQAALAELGSLFDDVRAATTF
jgi:hypothetical protein